MTTKNRSDGEFSHVYFGEIPYKYGRLLMYIWFKFIGARLSRKSIWLVFPQPEKTLIWKNRKKKPCLYKPYFICVQNSPCAAVGVLWKFWNIVL